MNYKKVHKIPRKSIVISFDTKLQIQDFVAHFPCRVTGKKLKWENIERYSYYCARLYKNGFTFIFHPEDNESAITYEELKLYQAVSND